MTVPSFPSVVGQGAATAGMKSSAMASAANVSGHWAYLDFG